jgi:hypothetical protein
MKFKHIVTHAEDLKYASFKISELEKLTREQEWKNKHMLSHKTYSALVYIVLTILTLYGIYKLGKFMLNVADQVKPCGQLQPPQRTI